MKVVDALKLNKHVVVSVPRNKDLYSRVGGRVPQLGTGGFKAEISKSKLDMIADSESALIEEMKNQPSV